MTAGEDGVPGAVAPFPASVGYCDRDLRGAGERKAPAAFAIRHVATVMGPNMGRAPLPIRRPFLAAAAVSAVALAATPALAFHCPQEMAKIDKALAADPKLSQADLAKVRQLRAKGDEEHKAGQHQESLDTLAQAEKLLGIQ